MTRTPERSDPQGPVTPPSLGEIFEISARRRRTRYRAVQGTLAVLSVAGIGLGLQGRLGNDGQDDSATSPSSLPASTSFPTNNEPEDDEPANPVADDLEATPLDGCLFVSNDELFDPWLAKGREAYFANKIVPVEELETLAEDWAVDFEEVKALVGFAAQQDLLLGTTSIDDALDHWTTSGYSADQLTAVAEEWNVSPISVKVVHFIGDPELQTALEACGLEPPAS